MKNAFVGIFLAALASFIWGAVSWMVIPWRNATVKSLPNETLIVDTIRTVVKEPGFFLFPADMNNPSPQQPDGKKAWQERMRQGPVGTLAFSPTGREPMGGKTFFLQFLLGLLVAAFLYRILCAARGPRGVAPCVGLAALIGLAAALATSGSQFIWFSFPAGFTLVSILDLVINFSLMGAVLAKFIPEE
jgi:hypothetical protein